MPTYCYALEDGSQVEQIFDPGEAPDTITLPTGEIARRDRQAELAGQHVAIKGSDDIPRGYNRWPIECYASGVHPNQADTLRKYLKDRGVPTDVTKNGDPIYTSEKHKRKALAVRSFHDKHSFV